MIDKRLFDELNDRIANALHDSPAADVSKNLRALLASWFDRFDLVSREDFDVQKRLLERAQAKLAELEARIAELEAGKAGDLRR
jgi:BMFP domain-containing protein YqiC